MINRIVVLGRLVNDPELKVTTGGIYYTRATIANEQQYKESKHTNFIDIVAWRGLAESFANYCKKGRKVLIEGKLEIKKNKQDDKIYTNTTIIAENIDFLEQPDSHRQDIEAVEKKFREVADDDCPF